VLFLPLSSLQGAVQFTHPCPFSSPFSLTEQDGFLKKAWRVHDIEAWFQREWRQSGEFRKQVREFALFA
jgi:hypothetical protein